MKRRFSQKKYELGFKFHYVIARCLSHSIYLVFVTQVKFSFILARLRFQNLKELYRWNLSLRRLGGAPLS
jgi:hypothetical protein